MVKYMFIKGIAVFIDKKNEKEPYLVWPTYFLKIKYKPNFYQVRLMLFYGTIFKIIKYKNLKIKYSIQIYQVHLAIFTKIKYNTWKSSAVGHTSHTTSEVFYSSIFVSYVILVFPVAVFAD